MSEILLTELNKPHSPAVLAGILGINVAMVYQGRQDGKLPPSADATYLECVHRYISSYKNKVNSRATNMGEAKLEQDIRNGVAKEMLQWLEIKQLRGELIDKAVLAEEIAPYFAIFNMALVALARQHPETQQSIDKMLSDLGKVSRDIGSKATMAANTFVDDNLEAELGLVGNGTVGDELAI